MREEQRGTRGGLTLAPVSLPACWIQFKSPLGPVPEEPLSQGQRPEDQLGRPYELALGGGGPHYGG